MVGGKQRERDLCAPMSMLRITFYHVPLHTHTQSHTHTHDTLVVQWDQPILVFGFVGC